MYLQRLRLQNIKCFENLEITFGQVGQPRLMTVILGDNGVGKSTLLQAIAIILGGELVVSRLVAEEAGRWARAQIGPLDGLSDLNGQGIGQVDGIICAAKEKSDEISVLHASYIATNSQYTSEPGAQLYLPNTISLQSSDPAVDHTQLRQAVYADSSANGWFACAYGPFRRFTNERVGFSAFFASQHRKSDRFASLFEQNDKLLPLEDWLIELDRRALIEKRNNEEPLSQPFFDHLVKALFNLLPTHHNNGHPRSPSVKVTKEQGILWQDSLGNWVPMSALSDGYQTMMAWAGDLVTRLSQAFPNAQNPLEQEGIVLIDEIDIHLHPTWQRQILSQLQQTFPKIQFIVTTHSPLVAGAAKEGEVIVLKREGTRVMVESEPSVQGWRIDQILTSDLFGLETTRDPETEQLLSEYDTLLAKRAKGELKPKEATRLRKLQERLRDVLPAPGETPVQRELYQQMQAFIEQALHKDNLP